MSVGPPPPSHPPSVLRRLRPLLLLGAALGLASYAQYAINRQPPGWSSFLDRLNEELTRIYHRPQSVALAFFLFLAAALLFLLAGREKGEPAVVEGRQTAGWKVSALVRERAARVMLALFVLGVGLWALIMWQLWHGVYEEWYPLRFAIALVAVAAAAVLWDLRHAVKLRPHVSWWEVALLLGLVGTFIGLNVRDLDGWRYAFIGDEGAFFDTAKLIDRGVTLNLFSQVGTYGDHPLAGSAYQAMVMKVFGFNYFGWKMASLLIIVAAIPPFYFLLRTLLGPRPAVFGTVLLSASHYLFAYAHTGYDSVFAVLPVVLAFAVFYSGLRRGSSFLLLASGIVSGLGFYTFYSSRAAIVILALFVFTLGWRRWRPGLVLPVSLGFLLAVGPMFAVDGKEVIRGMLGQSVDLVNEPLVKHILENVPRSLFAFNFNPDQGHYTAGALMDAVSGTLAMLGLFYALFRVGSAPYRFLVAWFAVSLVATGLFSPYDRVALTRLQIVLPVMAAFAGLAIHRGLLVFEEATWREKLRPYLGVLAFAGLTPLIFALNVERFWGDSARHSPTGAQTVAVRAVLEGPCDAQPGTLVVSVDQSPWMVSIFGMYSLGDPAPKMVAYKELSLTELASARCAVLMQTEQPEAQAVVEELKRSYPDRRLEELTDLSGSQRVLVLK